MSSSNCCFLTCIQVSQEAGQVVWYSHLFQNFPQFIVIHTVKDFGIVNKAEIDVFLELSCFFDDPADVGNLISGSSAFSKTSLNIWKFKVQVLLKPSLENFEQYFTSMWDECNCECSDSSALPIFGIGMKTDLFQSCGFTIGLYAVIVTVEVNHYFSSLSPKNNDCWSDKKLFGYFNIVSKPSFYLILFNPFKSPLK